MTQTSQHLIMWTLPGYGIELRLIDRVIQRTTAPASANWAFLMLLGERLCTVKMCEQGLDSYQMGR